MADADFTVKDVLEWARTKPADERYEYVCNGECAIALFLKETGRSSNPYVGGCEERGVPWRDGAGQERLCLLEIGHAALAPNEFDGWTFGGFAARLSALLPAEPVSDTWTHLDAYLVDIELASA